MSSKMSWEASSWSRIRFTEEVSPLLLWNLDFWVRFFADNRFVGTRQQMSVLPRLFISFFWCQKSRICLELLQYLAEEDLLEGFLISSPKTSQIVSDLKFSQLSGNEGVRSEHDH